MPFGIAAAPATFQKMMSKMLGSLNWKIAIVYLEISPTEAVFGRKIRCENVNFGRSKFAGNPNMTSRRFGVGQKVLVKRNMTSKD